MRVRLLKKGDEKGKIMNSFFQDKQCRKILTNVCVRVSLLTRNSPPLEVGMKN